MCGRLSNRGWRVALLQTTKVIRLLLPSFYSLFSLKTFTEVDNIMYFFESRLTTDGLWEFLISLKFVKRFLMDVLCHLVKT